MVYAALCSLLLLGDDLSRIDRKAIASSIASLECPNEPGLYMANILSSEKDIRFIFSAVASCYILNELQIFNCDNIVNFINRCQVSKINKNISLDI